MSTKNPESPQEPDHIKEGFEESPAAQFEKLIKIPIAFKQQERKILEGWVAGRKKQGRDLSFRWNLRLKGLEQSLEEMWTRLETRHLDSLHQDFKEDCIFFEKKGKDEKGNLVLEFKGMSMGIETFVSVLSSTKELAPEVDPFLEWLEDLPPWDKEERLSGILEKCFKVDTSLFSKAYISFCSAAPFLGAVHRTLYPGAVFQYMVIVHGEQGLAKSEYWKTLVPDRKQYYATIDLSLSNQKLLESIGTALFAEWEELQGGSKAEGNKLKSCVTTERDRYRPPYGRTSEVFDRRFVITGSVNDDDHLPNDPSGNRRYWPITVKGFFPKEDPRNVEQVHEQIEAVREMLWAEALYMQRENPQTGLFPSGELAKEHSKVVKAFRRRPYESVEDATTQAVNEIFDTTDPSFSLLELERKVQGKVGRDLRGGELNAVSLMVNRLSKEDEGVIERMSRGNRRRWKILKEAE